MTIEEIEAYLGHKVERVKATPEDIALEEAGAKWRAEMEAKIKAMPEPERSKQWERWENRLSKWND
jgi:hypothetical protein